MTSAGKNGEAPLAPPRATEEALRQAEEQFSALFNLTGVGMAQADPRTGRLLRVNQKICEFTGYSAEELCRMSFHEFTHPEDREADRASFTAMVRGDTSTHISEKRYVRKDGGIVWVLVTGSVVRDASLRPLRTVAIIQDVTERRRAEEALRENEARMRSLLDSTAEGIWGLDQEGRCTFANPACVRLLGYESAEELLGQNMHELTHRLYADGRRYPEEDCRIYGAFRTGRTTEIEDEVFLRRDGSSFAVHYRASPVVRDGKVVGAVVIFREITERRRAEGERARTLTLLNTLADNAAEALYLMDFQGRTTFMNPAAERMFGWTREETLGRVLHELIHHKRPDGSAFPMRECSLGRVMRQGEPLLDHMDEFLHKNGQFVPVSCSIAPVITEGQISGAVLVVHDLTERQRAEKEARKRAEFEQQLIGIVSHDLRSPIAAMLLSAQALMRREDIDPLILKSLARIVSSGERATRLIRDLLDFTQARLGSGIPIQRRPGDIHELVRQVMEEVRQAHPHRDLTFEASGDGRGEWDPDRLQQITTNLVINALTYSPEESVVSVRTRAESDFVVLEVHNVGKPIPEEMLPVLFEPFRRGRDVMHTAAGNVGLGLFIVDQLVRAHGGTIQVSSTAAEGTTFRVRLPRASRP